MNMEPRHFFLSHRGEPWREVTREEYIAAEHGAGFHPWKHGEVATAAFSGKHGTIQGTTRYGDSEPLPPLVRFALPKEECS